MHGNESGNAIMCIVCCHGVVLGLRNDQWPAQGLELALTINVNVFLLFLVLLLLLFCGRQLLFFLLHQQQLLGLLLLCVVEMPIQRDGHDAAREPLLGLEKERQVVE